MNILKDFQPKILIINTSNDISKIIFELFQNLKLFYDEIDEEKLEQNIKNDEFYLSSYKFKFYCSEYGKTKPEFTKSIKDIQYIEFIHTDKYPDQKSFLIVYKNNKIIKNDDYEKLLYFLEIKKYNFKKIFITIFLILILFLFFYNF